MLYIVEGNDINKQAVLTGREFALDLIEKGRRMRKIISAALLFLFMTLCSTAVNAGYLTLLWDPPKPSVSEVQLNKHAGYKIHYGTVSRNYKHTLNVGNVTSYRINNLDEGVKYYFTVSAYDASGSESPYANEASTTIAITPAPEPEITVSDSSSQAYDHHIEFGNVTEGSSSYKEVTITNNGNADLEIGDITGIDPVTAPFAVMNDHCSGRAVSPSSFCTFAVLFSPEVPGSFRDTFDIPSNDQDEHVINFVLEGHGDSRPVSDIIVTDMTAPFDDHKLTFGDITEGIISYQRIVVMNEGDAGLVMSNIVQRGNHSGPFKLSNDQCSGRTLAVLQTCSFTVLFMPSSPGVFRDMFKVVSNDPDEGMIELNVKGTGLTSVHNNPPSIPKPVFPADMQEGLDSSVEFRWERAADPDGDGIIYELHVCSDINMISGCINGGEIQYVFDYRSVHYAGMGGYSLLCLLMAIAVVSVKRGSFRLKNLYSVLIIIAATVILSACGSGGSGGGSGSGSESSSQITNSDNAYIDNNDIVHKVTGLDIGTTYYWKVVVRDVNDGSSSSSVRSFKTGY